MGPGNRVREWKERRKEKHLYRCVTELCFAEGNGLSAPGTSEGEGRVHLRIAFPWMGAGH